jgi:glycosyltransferase involved in cell wall biosynthesis
VEPKVLIITPAFKEEATIVAVLEGLKQECHAYDILVINDASTDQTSSLAKTIGGVLVATLKSAFGPRYKCVTTLPSEITNMYSWA